MNAVVTISIGRQSFWPVTLPAMERYAGRVNARFVNLTKRVEKYNGVAVAFHKFEIFHLLDQFERVLYIDSDILVRGSCPDLFKMVPESKVAARLENKFPAGAKPFKMLQAIDLYSPGLACDRGIVWMNTGVILASRSHKDLFRLPENMVEAEAGKGEQPLLNLLLYKNKYDFQELDYRFNYSVSNFVTKKNPCRVEDAFMFHATGYAGAERMRLAHIQRVDALWRLRDLAGPLLPENWGRVLAGYGRLILAWLKIGAYSASPARLRALLAKRVADGKKT